MTEPKAELQATANLSPVSPSPVHSATSLAVPVLQETVDTIDAMVAAAAAADANGSINKASNLEPIPGAGDDDIVDDDSLNDPYGEDDTDVAAQQVPQPQVEQELPDSNDDYAKTFDSPIGPEEGEDGVVEPQDVSSLPRESNEISLSSDHLTNRAFQVSHVVHESFLPAQPGQSATSNTSNASSEAQTASVATILPSQPSTQQTSSPSTAKLGASNAASSTSPSADIQRLVADLTAPSNSNTHLSAPSATGEQSLESAIPSSAFPSSASLPPRPPLSQAVPQTYASHHHPASINASIPSSLAAPPTPGQPSTYVATGVPVAIPDVLAEFPVPPGSGHQAPIAITSLNAPPYPAQSTLYNTDQAQDAEYERQWNQFLADENQYIAEAKWDRFPEGSRIFIGTRSASGASKNGAHIFATGNLSSDKVSKQDVFDLFHRFGRIAQISLKSAYGFVQYHSIEEGQRAMENLQGIEIKGRRIHLEVSRAQDKSKKDKTRSPDRNKSRDNGRRNDRHGHQNRDDFRSARGHSPHRNNEYAREEPYGRDRGYYDNNRGRGRSRSPTYGRNGKDNNYRRRSPSPYGRPRHEAELDLPRRYGADVPDVQVILQPDVNRDFVNWVEQAFKSQGLRSEVMFLHPRIPKDMVVQRQAAEGVHAVVDLDIRAQNTGKIPVQAFDRSAGSNNVRYDQYENLDPATAAKVILQAKASGGPPNYAQAYRGISYGGALYGNQPRYQAPAANYPGPPPPAQYGQQPPPVNVADIANMMGQLDPASLQQLLAQVQGGVQNPASAQSGTNAATAGAPQPDIQALLGSLGGNGVAQQPQQHPSAPYGASYGHGPQPPPNGAPPNGDAAVQVQNIMAQLARYRQ
ncbi:RNA-binding [Fusarium beomiforme]|uniref:RNA-binding n=1 Tax=Fusarium beomiforme TaxID=44412 RepID=A0A9P5AKL8_9HYPO|nr:RNA-binding [Fusarium beomiforme]